MAVQETGMFRIVFDNSAETNPRKPIDNHTSVISGGAQASPTGANAEAIPFAGFHSQAGERLIVYFTSDASDTIESEESDWEIAVNILDKNTLKKVGTDLIKMEAMTGFTGAGTVDVVCVAGIPARLAYIDAPTNYIYSINPSGRIRAYLGDDT